LKENSSTSVRLLFIIIRLKNYIVANYKHIRKSFFSFLIFVIISSAFWFYRTLDDVYVASVHYPVKYINIPSNKILSGNPPQKIILRVRGKGFTILSNRITPPTLDLDVNDFSLFSQSKDSLSLYLLSRYAHEWFAAELSNKNNQSLEILNVSPDTIAFNFTRTSTKKIPIQAVFTNNQNLFARQHMLNGKIIVIPDSTILIGPANILDTIQYLTTLPIHVSELQDTLNKKVGLARIDGTKLTIEKVKVIIPVDRFTETTIEVPVSIWHAPDSIDIKVFPGSVKITYKVTLSMYNHGNKSDFYPYVDFFDIDENTMTENAKLKVHLDTLPYYARSINIYPSNVEFLIELTHAKSGIDRGYR
jgi:hypothetical protein